MQVAVYNTAGEPVGQTELQEDIFAIKPNEAVMHQALVRQLANARLGTHKTKTRGEVIRTTAKWYRQKGTGRARHGSRKANIFVGGGVAHGPRPRSYRQKMPRKMRRLALRSALSAKAAEGQIIVLDELRLSEPRTKEMLAILEQLVGDASALILLPEAEPNVERSARNLPDVKTLRAQYLNIRDILGHEVLIMPLDAKWVIENFLG